MNHGENLEVVDEKQAAAIMKRSVQTLRNERSAVRGCPYVKMGKSVRYLLSDIHDFIEKRRIDPEAV